MVPVTDSAQGHQPERADEPGARRQPEGAERQAGDLTAAATTPGAFSAAHGRRLREVYRSAGWPCRDLLEVDLLAAGLLERRLGALGHETLHVTDTGLARIAATRGANRARRDPHEALVERVAREMTRAGRLAWRGLSLRARVDEAWCMAMPDVYSIRETSVEAYLEPIVHEVKVSRADLLSDLRRPAKRAAYLDLSSECWYAIRDGIATPDEIPPEFGVLVATATGLEVARPARKRAMKMPFGVWMALARATPVDGWRREEVQGLLGAPEEGGRVEPCAPCEALDSDGVPGAEAGAEPSPDARPAAPPSPGS